MQQECLLCQVFGRGGVAGHPQAQGKHFGLVGVKQGGKCVHIPLLGSSHEIGVRRALCTGVNFADHRRLLLDGCDLAIMRTRP